MRRVTRDEAAQWMSLAQEHGFASEKGFALGRFVAEGMESGNLKIRFVTPMPAGLYSEDLRPKEPPMMFDRLATGEIIFPGRWWQDMFEKLSEAEEVPDEVRRNAALTARVIDMSDGFLPADTDTVEIRASDAQGNLVAHEALPPNTIALIRLLR